MPFDRAGFDEDTEFERLVIARLGEHRLREPEPSMVYHAEANPQGRGQIRVSIGPAIEGAQLRDELRSTLRPLSFGAAYKILDMLVEHVLRLSGGPQGRLRFDQKLARVGQPQRSRPTPLAERPEVWDRLARLYGAFNEARHAVAHRRAKSLAGEFVIYDEQRQEIDRLTDGEISAFTAAVHGIAEAVIDADADDRRLGMVAWYLNELQGRHQLPTMSEAVDPTAGFGRLIMDAVSRDDGQFSVDIARAREITGQQPPSLWEVELRAGTRVFLARWEDFPDQTATSFDFDPDGPPDWLVERVVGGPRTP